jgi:site-specific recombinase XerD
MSWTCLAQNDEPVHVPLNSDVLAAIPSLPSWKERTVPIFRNQRASRQAGPELRSLVQASAQQSRHREFSMARSPAYLRVVAAGGVPLDRVSNLLGHKSLTMAMRYAHLAPSQLHEAVELLT